MCLRIAKPPYNAKRLVAFAFCTCRCFTGFGHGTPTHGLVVHKQTKLGKHLAHLCRLTHFFNYFCLTHSYSLSRTLSLSILGLIFIHLWHVIKEVPHKLIRPKSKQIHVRHNPTFVPLLCIQRVLRIHIYIYV